MSSSALNQGVLQAKINNVQNQADTSAVYSGGVWSFKNSSAVASVTITDAGDTRIGTTASLGVADRLAVVGGNVAVQRTSGIITLLGDNTQAGYTGTSTNHPFVFLTNGTERARIDASGNLLVNTTSGTLSGKIEVASTTNSQTGFGYYFNASAPTGHGFYVNSPQAGTNTANWNSFYARVAGGDRFYVTGAGTIYATNTTVQPIASDRNLKQDIIDFDKGLPELLKMKPRYFSFKSEPSVTQAGFIAQEMDEALPGAMVDSLSKPEEGEQPFKTYQVDWYPLLVKAIQELSAKVDAQAAEIEALKAK